MTRNSRLLSFFLFLLFVCSVYSAEKKEENGWESGDNFYALFFGIWGGACTVILSIICPIICFPVCLCLPCVIHFGPPTFYTVVCLLIILAPILFPIYIGAIFLICIVLLIAFVASPLAIYPFGIFFIPIGGTLAIVFFFLDLQLLLFHIMFSPITICLPFHSQWVCAVCFCRCFKKFRSVVEFLGGEVVDDVKIDKEEELDAVNMEEDDEPKKKKKKYPIREDSDDDDEDEESTDDDTLPPDHADYVPYQETNVMKPVVNVPEMLYVNSSSSFTVQDLKTGDVFGEEFVEVKKGVFNYQDCEVIVVAAHKSKRKKVLDQDRVVSYQKLPDYPHILIEKLDGM